MIETHKELNNKEIKSMEILARIEQACKDNNHEAVRQILDIIESDDLKKKAFLKTINYYENEEAVFPAGFVILFIKWLAKNGDFNEAGIYIEKMDQAGIGKERISELIYEYIIKPEEQIYELRFKRNMELLTKNRILFTEDTFDFDYVKKKITFIKKMYSYPEGFMRAVSFKKESYFLVDLTDMDMIRRLFDRGNYLYLAYNDLSKFYYMILFEDLLSIRKNIEAAAADKDQNVIFFAGKDMDNIRKFFNNMLAVMPRYVVVRPVHKEYQDVVKEIHEQRGERILSYKEELKSYYRDKGEEYYKNLMERKPSEIKVLLITSRSTTLNQHIARNWHNSFVSLGYTSRLLIEQENYERMNDYYPQQIICEFKPDIVFNINHTVNGLFNEKEIKNSLLWIMRYRDFNNINFGEYEYQNENMFVLPLYSEFTDALKKGNMPQNRIHYTLEGVDINIFSKSNVINDTYACDIANVNNAAGSELLRLEYYLNKLDEIKLQEVIRELYDYIRERALNDIFVTENEFIAFFSEKKTERGFDVNMRGMHFIIWFYMAIINAFYRGRVMEWIVDSGITGNIKVWGNSWSNIEKFKKYHQGVAMHGKELSEIYESSRISLCDTWGWNTHERNYEILGSGGFPLVKSMSMEEQEKMDSITNYFKENEEIVLFHDKDDLLNKVQYYLDNPEERERIAENGRNVVIQNFSALSITGKTMEFIKEYYRK